VLKYGRSNSAQLGGGGGYVDNKMVSCHILHKDWTKEISFVNFSTQVLPGPGNQYTKTPGIGIYIIFYHPKKIAGKVGSAEKLRITAKYFRRSILKGSRQMLWYLYCYLIHALGYPRELRFWPETHIKRQATQHGCLPSLLGDGDKGMEKVSGEEKSILYWTD
jgi:hypothetical protein